MPLPPSPIVNQQSPITSSSKQLKPMHFYFPVTGYSSPSHHHLLPELKGLLSSTPTHSQIINDDFWNAQESFSRFTVSSGTKNKWTQAPYHESLQTLAGAYLPLCSHPYHYHTHSFTRCQSQRPFYPNGTPNSYIKLLYFTNLSGTLFLKFSSGRLLPSSHSAFLLREALPDHLV